MDPEELAVILAGLWERNFAMIELDEIMRQREDRMFAEMLNRLDYVLLHIQKRTYALSNLESFLLSAKFILMMLYTSLPQEMMSTITMHKC